MISNLEIDFLRCSGVTSKPIKFVLEYRRVNIPSKMGLRFPFIMRMKTNFNLCNRAFSIIIN